jgi:UDP-N-acetyl-D-glucosamine dehydrogenase
MATDRRLRGSQLALRVVNPEIAIVGAGYVGMPHAQTFADAGKRVVLVDIQQSVVDGINRGESHIEDVGSEDLERLVDAGLITATTDFAVVADVEAIVIAVPTPLSAQRVPDLTYIERAARDIAPHLKRGHVVVLESTTYPGTTREVLQPVLETGSGLKAGTDFFLAFAPERVDPGRTDWTTKSTPKVVGGIDAASTKAAATLYRSALDDVHEVSTAEAAELTKLLENIFRSVNIALVNELAQLCDRMDIDVWEVIEAAATKPFGFMPFQPGPGLGGHCIPLDPYYLAWKAREFDFNTRFVELAGEINNNMPYFCRSVISQALNHGAQKSLKGSRILLVGVAYKADIGDVRESPAEKLLTLLRTAGADVSYHDPFVAEFDGLSSVPLEPTRYDCIAIVTAHSTVDYDKLVDDAPIVVDLRNATGVKGARSPKVFKL